MVFQLLTEFFSVLQVIVNVDERILLKMRGILSEKRYEMKYLLVIE
jgi:hypothetical protein